VSFGKLPGRLHIELLEEFQHLLQSPRTDVLKEAAFLNAFLGGDVLSGKMVLLENLEEMPA